MRKLNPIKCGICTTVLAVLTLLLGGCVPSNAIEQRAIIQIVGLDLSEGGFTATLEYFAPKGGGDQPLSMTEANSKIAKGEGMTISEAISNAVLPNGKTPFYAQSSIVILGEELAANSIDQVMNFINHDIDLRVDTEVFIAEGKASDIVSNDVDRGILPGESIERLRDIFSTSGLMFQVEYYEFANSFYSKSQAAYLPMVTKVPIVSSGSSSESGNSEKEAKPEKQIAYMGTAVINNQKAVGKLDFTATRGALWLTNRITSTSIDTKTDNGSPFSVDVISSETVVTPVYNGEHEIRFDVQINNVINMREFEAVDLKQVNMEEYEKLNGLISGLIKQECEKAWEQAAVDLRADIFEYGLRLRTAYPALTGWVEENWQAVLPEVQLNISVINRIE